MLKNKLPPSVFGILSCALMTVSLLLPRIGGILNFILVVVTLCICVHFVRSTAQIFDKKVLQMPSLVILICMPIFNLLTAAFELLLPGNPFMESAPFSVVLIAFSLPAFFCYYFLYVVRKDPVSRLFVAAVAALEAIGAVYLGLKLCDSVVFPLIERGGVYEILPGVRAAAAGSGRISVAIYLLSIVCFLLLQAGSRTKLRNQGQNALE